MTTQGPMVREVVKALKDAPVLDRDRAAVQLVRRYAQLLDAARNTTEEASAYGDLGPKLLAALSALGMTVAGRGVKGGGQGAVVAGKLDELRARRESRSARAN